MSAPVRTARPEDLELLVRFIGEFYAESGYALDAALARRAMGELLRDPSLGRLWLRNARTGVPGPCTPDATSATTTGSS